MGAIRRRPANQNSGFIHFLRNLGPLQTLTVGIILGAWLMFLYLGPSTEILVVEDPNSEPQQQLRFLEKNKETEADDGWHDVHVFFGDREKGLQHLHPPTKGSNQDARPLPQWFSQVHQDELVVDLIGKGGYFLDLAANDAMEFSNTLALERDHGWRGLCIEPNPGYWYGLAHRRCQVVGALIGGQTQEEVSVKFRGVYGGIVGKLPEKLANRKKEPDAPEELRFTAPVREVLKKFRVPSSIDYMSLDVEGAELMIMKEFPFDEFVVKLMTIERPNKDLKQLLDEKGYIFLKRLAWWGETLWAHKSTGLTPEHPRIQQIQTEERN